MFVYEKVSEIDKDLYYKISKDLWHEGASWYVDNERELYIICIGRFGWLDPYFFMMNYKDKRVRIQIWERRMKKEPEDIWVSIPNSLSNDTEDISRIVHEAYAENVFDGITEMAELKEIKFAIRDYMED